MLLLIVFWKGEFVSVEDFVHGSWKAKRDGSPVCCVRASIVTFLPPPPFLFYRKPCFDIGVAGKRRHGCVGNERFLPFLFFFFLALLLPAVSRQETGFRMVAGSEKNTGRLTAFSGS